jgi:thiol-disulfide isomerase/thioredoxin
MNDTLRYLVITATLSAACALFARDTPIKGAGNFRLAPRSAADSRSALGDEGRMPDLDGAIGWLNSPPLSSKSLHGKVVLVNFWTYTCINSLRPLPYIRGWATKYGNAGLVVIGVHTPEFSFEHEPSNVTVAVRDLKVTFPIAIDSDYKIWHAFNNEYWPAQYLIDGRGRIRFHHFGEGEYGEIEQAIQKLLKENGATNLNQSAGNISGVGVESAPDFGDEKSPETYVGYREAERFASPTRISQDSPKIYSPPAKPSLNQWGLNGTWNVGSESAVLQTAPGKIVYRFHSRDLHMVLAPMKDGSPVRFKVTVDGAAPGDDCGSDSAPGGTGVVREPRLYQLIRQKRTVEDRTFEIEFLDPGVRVFVFTFG